jgi:hypothetical protein
MNAPLVFDPIFPLGAILALGIVLAALTIAIYQRVGTRLTSAQSTCLVMLRLAGVGLVVVLLLQPSRVEPVPPPQVNRVTLLAVDNSRSMAQRDVAAGTRLDAARQLLRDADLVTSAGVPTKSDWRMFRFAETATPLSAAHELDGTGATTRIHSSITAMLGSLHADEGARALILLSDGHDFELTNPAKTGFAARARQVPIFAVPFGKQGKVRDASVRITSYQPYTYVKQKARIGASLRLVGCELEKLSVVLKREGKIVQTQVVQSGEESEIAIHFDVTEPAVGQYEYEVRVVPLNGEVDEENNSALTYLNVIDQQIRVLFLEGEPYWDTTFLQRSLMRNEKMNVDSITLYAEGKARSVRKTPGERELKPPAKAEEWKAYDVIVLGRSVDKVIGAEGVTQLEDYVKNGGGTVVFSRGRAFTDKGPRTDLEPVTWGDATTEHVRLQATREGQALAPFRALAAESADPEKVPDLIAARAIIDKKPLAASLAGVQSADPASGAAANPGMVHRRVGAGQVLSIGVDGLWRWGFNAKIEGANTLFDRFWDQMILWLMAGRDFLPTQKFSLRANSANVPLGEKIYFRGLMREPAPGVREIPLTIRHGSEEAGRTTLAPDPNAPDKLTAEFVPGKPGKYEATAKFPDGSEQTARFIVFDENLEPTEVATDVTYLRKLCESSGGRLLQPEELGNFVRQLSDEHAEASPQTRLVSAWDRVWFFWLIGLCFAADWFLRRRWGLS